MAHVGLHEVAIGIDHIFQRVLVGAGSRELPIRQLGLLQIVHHVPGRAVERAHRLGLVVVEPLVDHLHSVIHSAGRRGLHVHARPEHDAAAIPLLVLEQGNDARAVVLARHLHAAKARVDEAPLDLLGPAAIPALRLLVPHPALEREDQPLVVANPAAGLAALRRARAEVPPPAADRLVLAFARRHRPLAMRREIRPLAVLNHVPLRRAEIPLHEPILRARRIRHPVARAPLGRDLLEAFAREQVRRAKLREGAGHQLVRPAVGADLDLARRRAHQLLLHLLGRTVGIRAQVEEQHRRARLAPPQHVRHVPGRAALHVHLVLGE